MPTPNMSVEVLLRKVLRYVYTEQNAASGLIGAMRMAGFGDRIKELRKKAGMTLDRLAELSGSSKSYVWELENRNPPRPSADKITRIATVLGVTADYLMGGDGDLETAEDEAFFRRYRGLDPAVKERIRKMSRIITED